MSATQPTALETISIIADGIDRARDHLECALQFAARLQHDHRVDPVERAAIEQLTAHGRTDGVLDPDDDQEDVDDDTPELRPAAAVIPFPNT